MSRFLMARFGTALMACSMVLEWVSPAIAAPYKIPVQTVTCDVLIAGGACLDLPLPTKHCYQDVRFA